MKFRKRHPTDPGAPESNFDPTRSKKQRVVDGIKILFDVAKESADWFPPLKSALGGVNALIKHYEQFEDVREKVEELLPQLDRFKQNITTTTVDGDPEETNRRLGLTATFKKIEEVSHNLSAKSATARFADKGEDSKIVARLIERLREAIVCYQISQQQAIYRQIAHLTTSFDTLLRLQEKPPAVRDKLESVMVRLDRMRDAPWKELQHERWAKLFDDLKPVMDKARALYERVVTEGYTEHEGDTTAVSGLAEDLRDALLWYGMSQQQAVYDQSCRLIDAADLSVLNNCRRAQGAEHCHGSRRGCLKGTRETVLKELELWAKDFNQSPVFWLNGLAGTGKSTIAQTVSERTFADGQLGASFFCSRDFEDRSDLHFIFPTLAFQLAHKFPEFRYILVPLLQSNPDVAHESLYRQMEKLIVEPLRSADISTVIVIDALDECKDEEPSSAILSVLARLVGRIPKVKFFITGRPEPRIRTGFRLPMLVNSTSIFVLHDVDPPLINSDIRLFLKHELSELAQRRQLGRWPSDQHIGLLCSRAAGLFVYAVATVKFLDSNIYLPKHRLDVIVKLPECTAPEGKTRFNPKTTLDSLYASILQTAFIEGDPGVYSRVRSTLGAVVLLVNPLPPPGIAELVGLEPEEVILFLTSVQSLLALGEGFHQPVKPFHKSFPDFITDPSRCTDMRFYISPKDLHLELAVNCLEIMNDELERNLLSLPDYALNSGVEDLQTRIDDRISIALRYACRSWHNHLTETKGDVTNVVSYLHTFLEEKFLAWLEVVSVVGAVGAAVVALERLMPWLQEVAKDEQLLDIARDCFQFVTNFFEVINVSVPHIYHSALELCPVSSTIRKLYYHRRINHSPKVVIGTPESWAPTIGVSGKDRYNGPCIWSPCGRFVAVQTRKAVEIRNQLTLELVTILQPTETTHHLTGLISYSPDGRSIACASEATIIIWDVQTGGVAKEIGCGANNISLVWSLDGQMLCTINPEHRMTFIVHTYDVSSGTTSPSGTLESESNPHLWGHGKSFRVMTTMRCGRDIIIDIFEVKTALTAKIRSYLCPLPNQSSSTPPPNHSKASIWSFSPTTHRVSVSDGHTLRISDIRMRLCLLDKKGRFPSHCFSSDGSLFAASQEGDVHIWKYSLHRYHPWREFRCQGWPNSPLQFSPTPSSILGHSGDILQVWRLHELPTTPKSHRQPCVGISRSGTRITAAHELESTVTIIGPLAQTPPQFIDTNMMIEGFVLTGNVLLVADSETLVAWLLTEEGPVDGVIGDRRVGRSDSIWTVSLPRVSFDPCLFWVRGQVGVIKLCGNALHVYNTETGEVLHPAQAPQGFNDRLYLFTDTFRGRGHLCYHDLSQRDASPEDSWQISQAALRKGWVKDPEGKHRLWVPVEWRTDWKSADWLHDVTAQFSIFEGRPVLIKFYPSPTDSRPRNAAHH